ncbi:MAG: glycerol acyltransferase [Bacteroidales bacterium]|nr:glycerol acyltransferase [Bacteroidales bacterium]MBN2756841.1 glycerol acyltransferase [Bacteroidales bacterium]
MSATNNDKKDKLYLDIDAVFKKKNPSAYRLTPKFLINYLKKIAHQDELNYMLSKYNNLYGLDFTDALVNYFEIKTTLKGTHNLPKDGRFIFASNHPIGGVDGVVFINVVGKLCGPSKTVVNDLLLNIENFNPLFVGVNKKGRATKHDLEQLDKVYASNDHVLLFPAGLASRRKKGVIEDLQWRRSFIIKAIEHERDIIPVHITGQLSNFFYNFANFRAFLGIKANLEMLYLADETFKQKKESYTITFGKPISYKVFDNSKANEDWAQLVKEHVYKLKDNEDIDFKYD